MRNYLSHDGESGALRLVMTDYYAGQHEATAYTVVNGDGRPLRNRADMDGAPVFGRPGDWYVKAPAGGRIHVATVAGERSATERTPCPRAENKRRKCTLCAAQN